MFTAHVGQKSTGPGTISGPGSAKSGRNSAATSRKPGTILTVFPRVAVA